MHRSFSIGAGALLGLVGILAAPSHCFGQFNVSAAQSDDGTVTFTESGVVPGPENCLGPLSEVSAFLSDTNLGSMPGNAVFTITVDPGLTVIPGSCVATSGTCEVIDPTTLKWTVTVAPHTTEHITYAVRIGANVPINTLLCVHVSAVIDGGTPETLIACIRTNSAVQCGLGAPALNETARLLLVIALAAGGMLVLRRRRA